MSGSVSPEFGVFIKIFVAITVLLGILYIAVLVKLVLYDTNSSAWRFVFGAITPGLVIGSLICSAFTDNKAINIASILVLTIINLIYLFGPVNTRLSTFIYNGASAVVSNTLVTLFSIVTSLFAFLGFVGIAYLILKNIKW